MTLQEIRALAKTVYYGMTGKSDVDDGQWTAILDVANRTYWREAVRGIGSLFAKDSADLSVTGGQFDYTGGIGGDGVYQIMDVLVKFSGEYYPLQYVIPQDRHQFNSILGTDPLIPTAYSLLGLKIQLMPRGTGTATLRVTYVPDLQPFVSESQNALDGKLSQFHQMLAYEAALSFVPPDKSVGIRSGIYTRMRQQWEEYLQSRHRNAGRMIRHVEHE